MVLLLPKRKKLDIINPYYPHYPRLININPLPPQLRPRLINLPQQLLVRLWLVLERRDPEAEREEEVGAEGD